MINVERLMQKHAEVLPTLLLIPVLALAGQNSRNKPDLSGTWKCVDSPKQSVYAGSALVIAHQEPQIKMSRRVVVKGQTAIADLVFFSDARGDTNVASDWLPRDDTYKNGPVSVTNWDGHKLTTKYSVLGEYREQPSGVMRTGTIETTDSWELSKDGNKLTQTRTVHIKTITGSHSTRPFNTPWGALVAETKYVYAR
jgi:hypothetical protein